MPDREPILSQFTVAREIRQSVVLARIASCRSPAEQSFFNGSIEFLAGEIEERRRQKGEHENAKQIADRERAHDLGAKSEEIRAPGKSQNGSNPRWRACRDFRILQ